MDNSYFAASAVLVISTLFDLYIMAIMLRLLFQMLRADFHNPISQFLVKITNPPLVPLRRIIPGLGGIDLASVLLMLALGIIELALINLAQGHAFQFSGLTVMTLANLIALLLNVFLIAIIIQVILSWVGPGAHNPMTSLLYTLTTPVLRPAQRIIPAIGGFDLSPIVALLAIQLLKILVVAPIADIARSLGA
ncbi:MAG: YggT family protein [Gammaproteobacteria bacterium]|nr:YggT family protein [Gammaproteobacteria bacterium]